MSATERDLVTQLGAVVQRNALGDTMEELIELLQASLDGDDSHVTEDVRALRRVLRDKGRPEDEDRLAARFVGARLCLVSAPPAYLSSVRHELSRAAGLLVDEWGTGLVVLVPGVPQEDDPRARTTRVVTRVQRVAPAARIGVSSPLARVGQAGRAAEEARRALELSTPGSAVLADDVWFDVAVTRLRDCLADSVSVGGPLERLTSGSRLGMDLRTTLATWLAHDCDTVAAAAELHLHPNTLRYRVRRAVEITGLDVTDPLQRLVAHLVLTSS